MLLFDVFYDILLKICRLNENYFDRHLKLDGLVKSPTSALCCISQSFNVRQVRSLRDRWIADDYKICTP